MSVILRCTAYIAAGYTLLVLAVFLLQRSLIYHPDKERPTKAQLSAIGLQYWPQAEGYQGLVSATAPQSAIGTAIVFHGNAGSAWHRDYYVKALEPMGYRVILMEYPGYGGRDGKLTEADLIADGLKGISTARTEFDDPIFLIGESMGCGVAAAVASESSSSLAGLLLITPWDSLAAVAQSHFWYLPAAWLVRDRFDSVTYLQGFDRPVAVGVAEKDNVIPSRHALNLYSALTGPKKLWSFKNAGHNDWPNHPTASWWKEAMAYIASGHMVSGKQ
ncbi:MAG: alpha/beta hydrolase [Desulfobacteraceae bacterium]